MEAGPRTSQLRKEFRDRFSFVRGNFADLATFAAGQKVNGILLDLGVSSMQFSTPERGFSLRTEYTGPLDMRMDNTTGVTAATVVNKLTEAQLRLLIKTLGEEPRAAGVARAIVTARKEQPLDTTADLVAAVARAKGNPRRIDSVHPATLTFQALRMFVNDELGALRRALVGAETLLAPRGVLAVLTFHSGESRVWKDFLRATKRSFNTPASFEHAKVVAPSNSEIQQNPRARSAHLRYAIRTDTLPRTLTDDFLQADDLSGQFASWLHELESKSVVAC